MAQTCRLSMVLLIGGIPQTLTLPLSCQRLGHQLLLVGCCGSCCSGCGALLSCPLGHINICTPG